MDYALKYNQLIAKARQRGAINGYFERHHVLPKALGGTYDSSNLVSLTAREHFIAHLLLARMHGGTMWHAITIMKKDGRGTARSFDHARSKLRKLMIGNSKTLGRKASVEERERMSVIRKGKPGRKLTEEQKQHLSNINKGKKFSQETKDKLSAAQRGIAKPEGFGSKISAARKGISRSQETKDKISQHYAALRETKRILAEASNHCLLKELS